MGDAGSSNAITATPGSPFLCSPEPLGLTHKRARLAEHSAVRRLSDEGISAASRPDLPVRKPGTGRTEPL